jgi:hypothetical protein
MDGWDVYALQSCFDGLYLDGLFGPLTQKAVIGFQGAKDLTVDGIAGVVTQRAAIVTHSRQYPRRRLTKGIIEHESSFIVGNHTAAYPNGTRDCGVVQRNTAYHAMKDAFDVVDSLDVLSSHLTNYYTKYREMGHSRNEATRLAAGAWNAPSWADRLARGETLPYSHQEHIEAYIRAVTVYL